VEVQLNTLYVVTRGAVLRRDHLTVQVVVEDQVRLTVPVHQLESVAVFGGVRVTAPVMGLCADRGVAVSFLSEAGRLVGRVDAPASGNVMLRREQFRVADRPDRAAALARSFVAGKVHNCRNLVLRAGREATDPADQAALGGAADRLAGVLPAAGAAASVDAVRGHEGDAAAVYFGAFGHMVRANRDAMAPAGRTRRPPRDRMNALLSFLYALLTHDCTSAAAAVGLDPSVGFLHVDRPGRPGLALDLVEEFRPLLADRLALALVSRQQVKVDGFMVRDGGAVEMTHATRRAVLAAYQQRKREEVAHPLLGGKVPVGRVPFLQARILARAIRGDLPGYVPFVPKN
jgi:CRISPR-associated protein Cas1